MSQRLDPWSRFSSTNCILLFQNGVSITFNNGHTYNVQDITQKVYLLAAISKTLTKPDLAFLEPKLFKI